MAAYLVPTVWCDKCGARVEAATETNVTDLRRRLKGEGWRRVEVHAGMEDRCPACTDVDGTERSGRTSQPLEKNPNWNGGRTLASNGYMLIKMPEHPLADIRGYVYEHRLVAERAAGRPLRSGEQVHHINGDKRDNRPENLSVERSAAHHQLHHRRPGVALRLPDEANVTILCECGCGTSLLRYDGEGRPRRFVSGHNTKRLS